MSSIFQTCNLRAGLLVESSLKKLLRPYVTSGSTSKGAAQPSEKERAHQVYYRRFASQLDLLRTRPEINDQESFSLYEKLRIYLRQQHQQRLRSAVNAAVPVEEIEYRDIEEPQQRDSRADKIHHYDLNENNYIYNHVHKRLDVLANVQYVDYPIYSDLRQLQQTYERRLEMDSRVYHMKVQQLRESISSHIVVLNQQELAAVLTSIKKNHSKPFQDVRQMIDLELRWLLKKNVGTGLMDLDLWFYVADLFYECRLQSTFVRVLVHHFGKERDVSMTNAQFLHLLFLVITRRDERNILDLYEERIVELLDTASIEDISVICLAYFKTKTRIKNQEILRKILERTILFLDNINPDDPCFSSIMKALRYSKSVDYDSDTRPLAASQNLISSLIQNEKSKELLFKSNYNMIHTLKFMEEYRIYDEATTNSCRVHLFDNLDKFRSKDIQYCLTSLANMAYNDLSLDSSLRSDFSKLSNNIEDRKNEFLRPKFSHHLLGLLRALALYGYYDANLMSRVNNIFSSSFDEWKQRLVDFDKTVLLLHVAPQIEGCDNYLKHHAILKQMSDSMQRVGISPGQLRRTGMSRLNELLLGSNIRGSTFSPKISRLYQKIANDLLEHSSLKDESYNFAFQYTMPQLNYVDLIISKDCQEPGSFDSKTLMPKQVPLNEKHCLLYATTRFDYFENGSRLCGYKQFTERLLKKLGYNVVKVNIMDFSIEELAAQIESSLNN